MTYFDRAYYEARIRQNERLAAAASNAGIRELHLKYVLMYLSLLDQAVQFGDTFAVPTREVPISNGPTSSK